MDAFHERLARLGLAAAGRFGFCLAGGYAVQAHGFVERRSKDVDLFTSTGDAPDFRAGLDAVVEALRADGLTVTFDRDGPTFTRLLVADPASGVNSVMELGVDWRAYPPVTTSTCTARWCPAGRYSGPRLLRLAVDHDPGFDPGMFADALRAVRRFPSTAFEPYALKDDQVEACARLVDWADEITG